MTRLLAALALASQASLSLQAEVLEQVHVLFRHGTRYPSLIDPSMADFWAGIESLGQPVTQGCMTQRGVEEMEYLGAFLRERYVDGGSGDDTFVNPSYDQFEVEARSDLSGCLRRVISVEAVLETLFPGAPVPVLTESTANDNFFIGEAQCPSYLIDAPQIGAEQNAFVAANFADNIASVGNVTGLGAPNEAPFFLPPLTFLLIAYDNMLMAQVHGYTGYDDWLAENVAVVREAQNVLEFGDGYFPPSGDRGRTRWEWSKHILDSMQASIDGEVVPKMNIYGSHAINVMTTANNLGVPFFYLSTGDTIIFELWRDEETEERVVRTQLVKRASNSVIDTYVIEEIDTCATVDCAETSATVEAAAWLANMNERIGEDSGCCNIGAAFFEQGCDDFFSAEASENVECQRYRQFCPQVACGPRGVVDHATLECVEVKRRGAGGGRDRRRGGGGRGRETRGPRRDL